MSSATSRRTLFRSRPVHTPAIPGSWQAVRRNSSTTVVTVVPPTVRQQLDATAGGVWRNVHAVCVAEALQIARYSPVHAVVVTPPPAESNEEGAMRELVARCPAVVPIVVAEGPQDQQALLRLGAIGVRTICDLTTPGGWQRLRQIVTQSSAAPRDEILRVVLAVLADASVGSRRFFVDLVGLAPSTRTAVALAREFCVKPATLLSRFFRAALPSPTLYLTRTRLLHAVALLESPNVSAASVANRLDYSSPQSFGRYVRSVTGQSPGELRRDWSLASALDVFTRDLLVPNRKTFVWFDPLKTG